MVDRRCGAAHYSLSDPKGVDVCVRYPGHSGDHGSHRIGVDWPQDGLPAELTVKEPRTVLSADEQIRIAALRCLMATNRFEKLIAEEVVVHAGVIEHYIRTGELLKPESDES